MSGSFKTFLKHAAKDFHNQSVNPPVVRASTIIFKSTKSSSICNITSITRRINITLTTGV